MIEVLSSFECTHGTFFAAVDLMDTYLSISSVKFTAKDVHVIGLTSMLMASKLEEVVPFKVSTVIEKMAHGKIKATDIVQCEEDILKTLGFALMRAPSLWVFIECLMVKLRLDTSKNFREFAKIAVYISKMLIHDYEILT